MLTVSAAAGGVALINLVGNLGGFPERYAMGLVQDKTGSVPLGFANHSDGSVVAGAIVAATDGWSM